MVKRLIFVFSLGIGGALSFFSFVACDWWSAFSFCFLTHDWLSAVVFVSALVIGGELTFLLFLDFSCLDILVRKWLIAVHNYLMIMKMIVYENYDYPNLEEVHVLLRRT